MPANTSMRPPRKIGTPQGIADNGRARATDRQAATRSNHCLAHFQHNDNRGSMIYTKGARIPVDQGFATQSTRTQHAKIITLGNVEGQFFHSKSNFFLKYCTFFHSISVSPWQSPLMRVCSSSNVRRAAPTRGHFVPQIRKGYPYNERPAWIILSPAGRQRPIARVCAAWARWRS